MLDFKENARVCLVSTELAMRPQRFNVQMRLLSRAYNRSLKLIASHGDGGNNS